jgi:hypothetical protein
LHFTSAKTGPGCVCAPGDQCGVFFAFGDSWIEWYRRPSCTDAGRRPLICRRCGLRYEGSMCPDCCADFWVQKATELLGYSTDVSTQNYELCEKCGRRISGNRIFLTANNAKSRIQTPIRPRRRSRLHSAASSSPSLTASFTHSEVCRPHMRTFFGPFKTQSNPPEICRAHCHPSFYQLGVVSEIDFSTPTRPFSNVRLVLSAVLAYFPDFSSDRNIHLRERLVQ